MLDEMAIRHRNKEASTDLVIPVELIGTVSNETALAHLNANILPDYDWLDETPAHNRVAIICGSGPSLKRSYDTIRNMDGDVFACNGAAALLHANRITVDNQAILEPHPSISTDFCEHAKRHLMASIVPPEVVQRSSNVLLWHPYAPHIENALKGLKRKFYYIGGGISVSLFCLNIAYTLGYRRLEIFGLDSSYEDGEFYANGNRASAESVNVHIEYNGKHFVTTFDMKQQVVIFMKLAAMLQQAGCKIHVYGSGLLPEVFNHPETEKPL